MIIILLAGTFGGIKLDEKTSREFPLFTICFSIAAVGIALYTALKRL